MPFNEERIFQIDDYVKNHLPNDEWYESYFSFIEDDALANRLENEFKTIRYIYKILEGLKSTDELIQFYEFRNAIHIHAEIKKDIQYELEISKKAYWKFNKFKELVERTLNNGSL